MRCILLRVPAGEDMTLGKQFERWYVCTSCGHMYKAAPGKWGCPKCGCKKAKKGGVGGGWSAHNQRISERRMGHKQFNPGKTSGRGMYASPRRATA
jgi:rubredoxin